MMSRKYLKPSAQRGLSRRMVGLKLGDCSMPRTWGHHGMEASHHSLVMSSNYSYGRRLVAGVVHVRHSRLTHMSDIGGR